MYQDRDNVIESIPVFFIKKMIIYVIVFELSKLKANTADFSKTLDSGNVK